MHNPDQGRFPWWSRTQTAGLGKHAHTSSTSHPSPSSVDFEQKSEHSRPELLSLGRLALGWHLGTRIWEELHEPIRLAHCANSTVYAEHRLPSWPSGTLLPPWPAPSKPESRVSFLGRQVTLCHKPWLEESAQPVCCHWARTWTFGPGLALDLPWAPFPLAALSVYLCAQLNQRYEDSYMLGPLTKYQTQR